MQREEIKEKMREIVNNARLGNILLAIAEICEENAKKYKGIRKSKFYTESELWQSRAIRIRRSDIYKGNM